MSDHFYATSGPVNGEAIWNGPGTNHTVARRSVLDEQHPVLWPVAVAVLTAPDDAVEHVAAALYALNSHSDRWDTLTDPTRDVFRRYARAALGALRDLALRDLVKAAPTAGAGGQP